MYIHLFLLFRWNASEDLDMSILALILVSLFFSLYKIDTLGSFNNYVGGQWKVH